MKKPKYPYRIAILMAILTIPPIGATQLGWYLYDMQTGFDYGMIVGTFSLMEKIIFFGLVIPIFAFVLYLGGNAIMKGMSAKNANKENENLDNNELENSFDTNKNLSEELEKLNNLLKDGVLTQEEFEKAKKKLLED